MALTKRTYVDGETIITAQNLNDIQDEIISHANTFVPKTRTINSKALDANITLTASDLGAVPTTRTVNSKALSSNITLTAADVNAVPTTRTVNSKALSSNITLSASDVGAVPTTRTVNSKALSSDITLTSDDIGYSSSTTYSSGSVGKAVSDLSGAINDVEDDVTALQNKISSYSKNETISDKWEYAYGAISQSGKRLVVKVDLEKAIGNLTFTPTRVGLYLRDSDNNMILGNNYDATELITILEKYNDYALQIRFESNATFGRTTNSFAVGQVILSGSFVE